VLVPVILIGAHQLSTRSSKLSPGAFWKHSSLPRPFSSSDPSSSIGRLRDRTPRRRSSMHPFPCSSGRPSALGLEA